MSKLSRQVDEIIRQNASEKDAVIRDRVAASLGFDPTIPDIWEAMPPTVREAINEVHRRRVLADRRAARKDRKDTSKFGRRHEAFRRIIHTEVVNGRECMFHATKGWRTFRVLKAGHDS